MRSINHIIALFTCIAGLSACAKSSPISVGDVRCEFLHEPLAIDSTTPHFNWKMVAKGRVGETGSSAYQIIVASKPELLDEDHADLWNSGIVAAPNTVIAKYEGSALKPNDFCYWKVRVWDSHNRASKWSRTASFGIGLLSESDWAEGAQFIGVNQDLKKKDLAPILRCGFTSLSQKARYILHVNSLGYHEVYVNGHRVSEYVLTPAVSEFDTRSLINTYDISDYIKNRGGYNEIVLHTGRGWYSTIDAGVVAGGPYVRAQLDAHTNQGISTIAVTNSNWQWADSGRYTFGSWGYKRLGGEEIDSRVYVSDFSPKAISKLEWKPVVVADIPVHQASPQMCERNRIVAKANPVSVAQVSDSVFVYDFGGNSVGFTTIEMPAVAEGQKVAIHYDDVYLKDAAEFHDGLYQDFFIGNGKKGSSFSSKFNYKGYRYIKIAGLPAALPFKKITRSSVRTDYVSDSSFECSDKDMNDIYRMIHRTVHELTLGGYMVDCPHIERLGYGGDGNASTPTLQTIADVAPLYLNWLQAYADSQDENGDMPHTGPNPYRAGGGPFWCTFIIPASWYAYVNYGDKRMIERFYPNMCKWIDFAESNYKDGLLKEWGPSVHRHWYLGDWATPTGINQRDPLSVDLVANCVMSQAYAFMAKIAGVLGKDDDASGFSRKHEEHNLLIHKTFYNEETGLYSTGTQIDMAYPMLVGATPSSLQENVKERLFEETAGRFSGHLSAGLVGVPVLTQWATAAGESQFMYEMLKKRDYPGYLYMIDNGANTTWEHWNGRRSHIHNCYNGIGTWFYQALAGLRPDESCPGYAHVIIKPQPVDGIDWVKAFKNTPYGKLEVCWTMTNGTFDIQVEIPVGSSATVYLPDGSEGIALESGSHHISMTI